MSKSKFSKRQIAGAILLSSMAIGATASGTASADLMDYIGKEASHDVGSYASNAWNWLKGSIGDYAVSTMDKGGEILKSGVNKIGDLASNTYNKVAGSKFWKDVGNVAGAIKNKTGDVYNWVKDSKGGQWVSDKAGDVYNWVKDSKVGNFVSDHAWGVAAIGLLSALTYGTYRAIKAGINYYSNKDFSKAKDNLLESIESLISEYKNNDTIKPLISNLEALKKSVSSSKKDDFNMDKARETYNKIKDKKLTKLFNEIENNYKRYCDEYDKKTMSESGVVSDISSVDITDDKVRLTTSDALKINYSELASAYIKAVESGYYDVNFVSAIEDSLPGVNKENLKMILNDYFYSKASLLSSIGIGGIYVNATNLSGDVVGQVCVMPDLQSGKGTVRLRIWAINKENFDATLRLMLRCLGENSKVKRICVSVMANSGKNFANSVKSVFDSKPKLFKKFNEIRITDYMRLDKNNSGEMVLATGSTRSVNGAAPVKEAAHEVVLKKEEISTYKNMISAGKLSFGSGSKDKDGDFLNVISTDYEFVK